MVLWGVLSGAYELLVVAPAMRLFREGPACLGGWRGQSEAAICAALTTVPAEHWVGGAAGECRVLVQREFGSFLVVVDTAVHGFLLYYAVRGVQSLLCGWLWGRSGYAETATIESGSKPALLGQ